MVFHTSLPRKRYFPTQALIIGFPFLVYKSNAQQKNPTLCALLAWFLRHPSQHIPASIRDGKPRNPALAHTCMFPIPFARTPNPHLQIIFSIVRIHRDASSLLCRKRASHVPSHQSASRQAHYSICRLGVPCESVLVLGEPIGEKTDK